MEHTTRRRFLTHTGGLAAISMLHGPDLFAMTQQPAGPKSTHRIESLRLLTSASMDSMERFYGTTLGLPVTRDGSSSLAIRAGRTLLTYDWIAPSDTQAPFYHVAFNIPENKVTHARDWLSHRTPIYTTPAHQRDEAFGDGVRHFPRWNAHAVFFEDPAGNVLECIGRHDLKNAAPGKFGPSDILHASEIALIVDDVTASSKIIRSSLGLPTYGRASEGFCAIGDEHGLLLVFTRGRDIGKGGSAPRRVGVFRTGVVINSDRPPTSHTPSGYPYTIETRVRKAPGPHAD